MTTVELPDAGFAYLPGASRAFSQGVIAHEGFVFHRVQLRRPLSLSSGLQFAAKYVQEFGRSRDSLCGMELRSPHRLTLPEFQDFNRGFIDELRRHGFVTEPVNPAARTNIAGVYGTPPTASLAAFTFAVPGKRSYSGTDFLASGRPELASHPSRVIAAGDDSLQGTREKCAFVLAELQQVVQKLGGAWGNFVKAQIYTRRPLAELGEILASFRLSPENCKHISGDPPVEGPGSVPLAFEADVRSITVEETV